MPARLLATVAAAVAVLAVSTAAVQAAAKVPYKTGNYTAKTSQGQTFKFRIVAHTATNRCGATAAKHCFIAVTYPDAQQSCGGAAPTDAGTYSIPNGFISSTGHFSYHQSDPDERFTAVAKGDKVTGTFRTKATTDTGSGPVTCDTGTVTWTAKRAR